MNISRIRLAAGILAKVALATTLSTPATADSGRGRHKQFYIPPAPGPVTIDARLDDWDLSGQIEMFVIEATRGTMSAKLAAMYDAEALYLSGEVRDPTPMMNRHDPGYIFGNREGTRAVARAYLFNNSFTANVLDDIPHESRLEPAQWGVAVVESAQGEKIDEN